MFTGIVQALGEVVQAGARFVVRPLDPMGEPWMPGESVAVNGCCLTVLGDSSVSFDLSEETLRRTTLGTLGAGNLVNLERALRAGDRLGGHFVQGHIDCVGRVSEIEERGGSQRIRFQVDPGFDRLLIDKGSIAVDGISLTLVEPSGGWFDTWIIPHTLTATNLQRLDVGDPVNVEFDMLAKHIAKLFEASR